MKKMSLFFILFFVYCILCYFPFIFDKFNQIAPSLAGIPFTVWSVHLLILLGCGLLYWGSKKAWPSFDGEEEGGDDK